MSLKTRKKRHLKQSTKKLFHSCLCFPPLISSPLERSELWNILPWHWTLYAHTQKSYLRHPSQLQLHHLVVCQLFPIFPFCCFLLQARLQSRTVSTTRSKVSTMFLSPWLISLTFIRISYIFISQLFATSLHLFLSTFPLFLLDCNWEQRKSFEDSIAPATTEVL